MNENYLNDIAEDNISIPLWAAQIRETKIMELKEIIKRKEILLKGLYLIYHDDSNTLAFKEINLQMKINELNAKLQILLEK